MSYSLRVDVAYKGCSEFWYNIEGVSSQDWPRYYIAQYSSDGTCMNAVNFHREAFHESDEEILLAGLLALKGETNA